MLIADGQHFICPLNMGYILYQRVILAFRCLFLPDKRVLHYMICGPSACVLGWLLAFCPNDLAIIHSYGRPVMPSWWDFMLGLDGYMTTLAFAVRGTGSTQVLGWELRFHIGLRAFRNSKQIARLNLVYIYPPFHQLRTPQYIDLHPTYLELGAI